MIASSHSADKKVYEIARLNNEVKELRSELYDGRTRLMQLKMESSVVKKMKEKGNINLCWDISVRFQRPTRLLDLTVVSML